MECSYNVDYTMYSVLVKSGVKSGDTAQCGGEGEGIFPDLLRCKHYD